MISANYPHFSDYDFSIVFNIIKVYLNIYDNEYIIVKAPPTGTEIFLLTQKERFFVAGAVNSYDKEIKRKKKRHENNRNTVKPYYKLHEVLVRDSRGRETKKIDITFNKPELLIGTYHPTPKIYGECPCGSRRKINYALPGFERTNCKDCKTDQMVNILAKKCHCSKKCPSFGINGESATHCFDCKSSDMVAINKRTCKSDYCDISANKKYDGYCTHCFRNLFPNDQRTLTMRTHTKEEKVKKFIDENFQHFVHDKPFYTKNCDCSLKRRIDHYIIIRNTCLAIETDENQHRYYNDGDEEARYNDLYMGFSGMFIYIRFNPDSYKDRNGEKQDPSIEVRLDRLKLEIEKQAQRIYNMDNKDLVEIIYLFYDQIPDVNDTITTNSYQPSEIIELDYIPVNC